MMPEFAWKKNLKNGHQILKNCAQRYHYSVCEFELGTKSIKFEANANKKINILVG